MAVGSLEGWVLVTARRFKELGAATGGDIETAVPIERATRILMVPELEREPQLTNGGGANPDAD